jgi:tripeptidyl-peptidase-1
VVQCPFGWLSADGSSPFIPDADEPTAADDENEPYLFYYEYLLSKTNSELPQVISNSYGDDEQVRTASKLTPTTLVLIFGLRRFLRSMRKSFAT